MSEPTIKLKGVGWQKVLYSLVNTVFKEHAEPIIARHFPAVADDQSDLTAIYWCELKRDGTVLPEILICIGKDYRTSRLLFDVEVDEYRLDPYDSSKTLAKSLERWANWLDGALPTIVGNLPNTTDPEMLKTAGYLSFSDLVFAIEERWCK